MGNTPTKFDENNITLSAIAEAFGISTIPKSLLDVQIKAQANSQSLYKETGEEETISLPRTTIHFSDFLGKYTPQCTGNIDVQENSGTAEGVQGVIGFNNSGGKPPYEIRGRTLFSLKIYPYYYANKQGAASSVGTNSEEVWYMYGTDAQIAGRTGVKVGLYGNTLANIRIPSGTLTPFILLIHIKINASSNLGGQVTVEGNWVYDVRYNGLTKR
jgi:hypothetical protein